MPVYTENKYIQLNVYRFITNLNFIQMKEVSPGYKSAKNS